MENANGLTAVRVIDPSFMHVLESGVRAGNSVLLEGIADTLQPTLCYLLLKQTFVQVCCNFMKYIIKSIKPPYTTFCVSLFIVLIHTTCFGLLWWPSSGVTTIIYNR
jgi:hypothetical protein